MGARIAVTRERRQGETRVAATPETVKKLVGLGAEVTVEAGAGETASIRAADYAASGAQVARDASAAIKDAYILLKVRGPSDEETAALKKGALVVGLFNP